MTATFGHRKLPLVGHMLNNHTVLSKTFPSSKLNLPKKPRVVEAEKEPFIKAKGGPSSLGPLATQRAKGGLDPHQTPTKGWESQDLPKGGATIGSTRSLGSA